MKKLTFLFFGIFFIISSCKEKYDFRDAYVGTYNLECEKYQTFPFNPYAVRDTTLIQILVSKAGNDNGLIVNGRGAKYFTISKFNGIIDNGTFFIDFYSQDSLKYSETETFPFITYSKKCKGIKVD